MTLLPILSLPFSLIALVCSIFILIHAFQRSVGTGFMALCIPCYILYYGFSEFEHPKKNLILTTWLICIVVGNILAQLPRLMH